jgi:arginase family enzyme
MEENILSREKETTHRRKKLDKIWNNSYTESKKTIPHRSERRLKAILYGDVPTFMELPYAKNKEDLTGIDVAFVGVPWEGLKYLDPWTTLPETAAPAPPDSIYYRTGADKAPEAIRKYSLFYSINHNWGYFPELDRDFIIFNHINAVDFGDVEVDVRNPEASIENSIRKISEIYEVGAIPLVSGGDHTIPYPCIRSLMNNIDGNLGIISFDSHFDLYFEAEISAASQWGPLFEFPQVNPENFCSIGIRGLRNQLHERFVAEKLGVRYFTMTDVEKEGITKIIKKALKIAGENTDGLYVSLDIDIMDPAFCPAQKYPEPGGLTSREIISAIRQIGLHQLVNGFDICCLGPQYDTKTGLSAQLCARLFMEVMATIAWHKAKHSSTQNEF